MRATDTANEPKPDQEKQNALAGRLNRQSKACRLIITACATIAVAGAGFGAFGMFSRWATFAWVMAGVSGTVGIARYALALLMRELNTLRSIAGRLQLLAGEMRRVASGLSSEVAPELHGGETAEVADAFKRVFEAGRADRERLVQKNAELQALNEQIAGASRKVETLALRAGEANTAKREFLAVMSHEIRTPVNGIIGMTELALQSHPTQTQRDHLEMINSCAESLLVLLNDILDFSKIEAGKLELERTEFSIRDMLGEALTILAPRAHGKGLELLLHIRPEVPEILIGDPHRLRQVIMNLVGNAIKFTERGEVLVRVENSQWVKGDAELSFSVSDTGIGIPLDRIGSIFTAFNQADYSTTRRFGGTGLGLAISQQIVRLMKGELEVDSMVGRGSTFRFSARFGYQNADAGRDSVIEAFTGKRALILDYNERSRAITVEVLEQWQIKATVAVDVDGAVRAIRMAKTSGNPFDIVIADAMMSESCGFALAAELSVMRDLQDTHLVLVVASGFNSDAARTSNPVIRATMAKPLTLRTMRMAIARAIESGGVPGMMMVQKDSRIPAQRQLRVLVAEDNAVNQRLVQLNLEGWGHIVSVVNDGKESVDAFSGAAFDLVLMDLQMPNLSGTEATVEIRKIEAKCGMRRTPILALSANVLKGIRDECEKSGMDGYVSKPVRQRDLLEAMASVVGDLFVDREASRAYFESSAAKTQPASASASVFNSGKFSTAGAGRTPVVARTKAQQTAVPALNNVPAVPAPSRGNTALFCREALMENLCGDVGMLAEVVLMCRDTDTPKLLKQLSEALAREDCAAVAKAAHGFKGMVGAVNATLAWQAANDLELAAREGRAEFLRKGTDAMLAAVRELIAALENEAGIEHREIPWA